MPDFGTYDTAQICPNGHVSNSRYEDSPELRNDFCPECGEKTLTNCPSCSNLIRGDLRGSGPGEYRPKSYCYACGKPFPWTQRGLDAAKELVRRSAVLSDAELGTFGQSLDELMKQTPLMGLAAQKLRPLIAKLEPLLQEGIRNAVTAVLSGEAKRLAGL